MLTDGDTERVGAETGGAMSSSGSWNPRPSVDKLGSALTDGFKEADGGAERVGESVGRSVSTFGFCGRFRRPSS